MFERIRRWWHVKMHGPLFYGMPTAGRNLEWDVECLCGKKWKVITPNTPQQKSPWTVDKTQPKTWAEAEGWK